MEAIKQFELSKEYLESLRLGIEQEDVDFIRESLEGVNVADIAAILDELSMQESVYVLRLLEKQLAADILIELDEVTLFKVLKEFENVEIAAWIELMDSDDGADILNLLSEKDREAVISEFHDRVKSEQILELLRYEEDTAGGIMAKEFIRANKNWNIVQTINEIRRQAENVEKKFTPSMLSTTGSIYWGEFRSKKIILAGSDTKIEDIYDEDVISVPVHMDQEEVASVMRKYDLESVPVINAKKTSS